MTETIRTKEPIVALTDWSVYEVPLFGSENLWTRHFVGFAEDLGLKQGSSAILVFDPEHGVAPRPTESAGKFIKTHDHLGISAPEVLAAIQQRLADMRRSSR